MYWRKEKCDFRSNIELLKNAHVYSMCQVTSIKWANFWPRNIKLGMHEHSAKYSTMLQYFLLLVLSNFVGTTHPGPGCAGSISQWVMLRCLLQRLKYILSASSHIFWFFSKKLPFLSASSALLVNNILLPWKSSQLKNKM